MTLFQAWSAFVHVSAFTLAQPPNGDLRYRTFRQLRFLDCCSDRCPPGHAPASVAFTRLPGGNLTG